jgi:hypothetical protein
MNPLATAELLALWERGLSQTSIQRSLALITAACPDRSREQVMRLSIGQRDRLLLTLREQLFGSQLVSVAACPACADRLELNFSVDDIRLPETAVPETIEVHQAGYRIQVRLPNSVDLSAMSAYQTVALPELRCLLLQRCLVVVKRESENQEAITITEFPEEVIEAISSQLAVADPQADIQLDLSCPACRHRWQAAFDIGSFLWTEIHAWAIRLLQEVHCLASAYSWSEAAILAMSAQRRRWYLELLGSVS